MPSRAVIAGVTGLIGSNLAEHLIAKGWEVYGIARNPPSGVSGVRPIAADFLNPEGLRSALADINPTHVFLTSWVRRNTEEENIAANGALVRNVLTAFDRSRPEARRPGHRPQALSGAVRDVREDHEGGDDASGVGDATGRDDGHRHEIRDLRHE